MHLELLSLQMPLTPSLKAWDIVITHKTTLGSNAKLKSDLSATLSKTKQVGDINASDVLERAGLVDTYFPADSRVYLEKAVPRTKVIFIKCLIYR